MSRQLEDQWLERIEITEGDITALTVEGLVNAANESLLGGGGVDGAIHRAAGPRLLEHNRGLGGCPTGLAVATPAFDLENQGVKAIIHTVGPVWACEGEAASLGNTHEDVLLASCYLKCLELAASLSLKSIAFPAISTGVYCFPRERAAKIAIGHVLGFLPQHLLPQRVIFCCFSAEDAGLYRELLASRQHWMTGRRRAPQWLGEPSAREEKA